MNFDGKLLLNILHKYFFPFSQKISVFTAHHLRIMANIQYI